MRRYTASHTQGAGNAAGPRQRNAAQPRRRHLGAQAGTGVADTGGAGIAHIGNALALLQARDDALRRLGLVVLVYGQQLGAGAL